MNTPNNIISYAESCMDTLAERPFSRVDSLVLSQLSYIHFEAFHLEGENVLSLSELLKAETFPSIFNNVRDGEDNKRLLFAVAMSPRFRDIKICDYINQVDSRQEKQFCAMTFILPGHEAGLRLYIAFRGTDATFTGWREDFNMAFMTSVPSQLESVKYLEAAAAKFSGSIILGGHSKGGNLAVYSGSFVSPEIQRRIEKIYSHDGPGFSKNAMDPDRFAAVSDLIDKTVPKQSLVGLLLESQEEYQVVESSRIGISQHDPFSWLVENNDFIYSEELSPLSQKSIERIDRWIAGLSEDEREVFVETLFSVLDGCQATSFQELSSTWMTDVPAILKSLDRIDPETRKHVLEIVKTLLS